MAICPVCRTSGPETGVLCPNGCAYLVREKALQVDGKGMERHLGRVIGGRYAVVGYLGRGGMGVVYRARDLRGRGEVALKLLMSAKPSSRARRRFLREAKVAAQLRHPNIVATYGFGRVEDGFYLAMELVEGQPLSRYWKRGLPFDAVVSIVVQALAALQAAHEAGIIHRDLKPGNILVGQDGGGAFAVKVVDFGLARFAEPERDDLTRTGELVGTPRYMSPEQARGSRTIDATTDLYAIGIILYEFVTGKLLFDAETATAIAVKHVTDPVPSIVPRKGLHLPAGFEGIIRKLLAKDPRARYLSAGALRAALTPYLKGLKATSPAALELEALELEVPSLPEEPPSISQEPSLSPGRGIRFKPRLVGRDDALGQLWALHLRAVHSRQGAVIFVSGETGIGKTRLLEAFRQRVQDNLQMDWIEGAAREGTGQGLFALRQVLAHLFGLRHEGREDARGILRATLARWGTPAELELEQLLDLLRPRDEEAGPALGLEGGVEHAARRENLFGLIERVLRRASAERPLVVVLEDLQWAGLPMLQLLEYLTPGLHATPAPLLIVATFRSDGPSAEEWLGLGRRMQRYEPAALARVALGRLDRASSRSMLLTMLNASEPLCESVFELTEGNPLHSVQVLRFLHDSDLLVCDVGTWELRPGAGLDRAVPPEVADLLLARLDFVTQRHRRGEAFAQIIERCALIGRQIPYELLRLLLRVEAELGERENSLAASLDEALDFFVAEGLLQDYVEAPEDTLEFTQGLLREVLNRKLRTRRVARLAHLAAAQAKEAYYDQATDAHAESIAEHYEAAREWEQALRWMIRAARTAHRSWDIKGCIAAWLHARELLSRLPDSDSELRCQIASTLGEIYYTEGRYDEASALFDEAFEQAESRGDTLSMAHLLFLRGDAARVLNDVSRADACYRECLTISRAIGDRTGIGRALLGLAKLLRVQGDAEQAEHYLVAAEEHFQIQGDRWALADTRRQLAWLQVNRGELDASRALLTEALELHRALEDKRGIAYIQRDLAQLAMLQGRTREAELQARRALDLFEGIGARFGFAQTLVVMGEIHRAQGHLQAAAELHAKALAIFEAQSAQRDIAQTHFYLGAIDIQAGRSVEARQRFQAALEIAAARELRALSGIAYAGLAWADARQGDLQGLRQHLTQAEFALGPTALRHHDLAEIYADCADALERNGDLQAADAFRERASWIWKSLGRE